MPSLRISTGDPEPEPIPAVYGKNRAALDKLDAVMKSINSEPIPGADPRRKWIGVDWKKELSSDEKNKPAATKRCLDLNGSQMKQILAESMTILDIDEIFTEWTTIGWVHAKQKQAVVDAYLHGLRERWGRAFNIPPQSLRFKQLIFKVAKQALAQVKKERQKRLNDRSGSVGTPVDGVPEAPMSRDKSVPYATNTLLRTNNLAASNDNISLNRGLNRDLTPDADTISLTMTSPSPANELVVQSQPQKSTISRVPSNGSVRTNISTTPPGSPQIQLLTTDYPSAIPDNETPDNSLDTISEQGSPREKVRSINGNPQFQPNSPPQSPSLYDRTEDAMMINFSDGTKDLLLHPSELSSVKYKGRYTSEDIEWALLEQKIQKFFGFPGFNLSLYLPGQSLHGTVVSEERTMATLAKYAFDRSLGAVMFRVDGNST
jgi:hypothetical protein